MRRPKIIALDLFAGSGWGVACRRLGIEEYGVEIMPEAIATREANGMETIFTDVWDGLEDRLSPVSLAAYEEWRAAGGSASEFRSMLIASPPCQTFSVAGKGAGRKALDEVLHLVSIIHESWLQGKEFDATHLRNYAALGDERTALVLTPLLYALRDLPTYIALEQVPTVLPVWEACAEVLRDAGYSVVTSVLHAEQYGVPQTRKRAILIARRDGREAKMPTPTHSKYYPRDPKRLDDGVEKWVSMAEALGWADVERPSPTVTGGGAGTGGAEPFGPGGRRAIEQARADFQLRHGRRLNEGGYADAA